MRYYEITLTNPAAPDSQPLVFSSWVNGKNDPGALNVVFNCQISSYATSQNPCIVAVYGIPIKFISQSYNLYGYNITIKAGFQKGLPLANANQNGIIIEGFVAQAYGNWVGNEMTLNFVISAGPSFVQPSSSQSTANQTAAAQAMPADPNPVPTGTLDQPINGSFEWPAGQLLSVAIANFLTKAFPKYPTPYIAINPSLVGNVDRHGVYSTIRQFADEVKKFSKTMIGGKYQGVDISLLTGQKFWVYDGTTPGKTTSIQFNELIGQPTWIQQQTIQFKCPMRADINPTEIIVLPKGFFPVIQTPNISQPWNYRNTAQQQGSFYVREIQHFGNFRQPSGDSWASLFTCTVIA